MGVKEKQQSPIHSSITTHSTMTKAAKKGSKNKRSTEEVVEEEEQVVAKVTEEEIVEEESNTEKKKKSKKDKKASKDEEDETEVVPEPVEVPKSKRSKKDKVAVEEEEKPKKNQSAFELPQFQPIVINTERQKDSKDIADTLTLAERLALASKEIAGWEDDMDEEEKNSTNTNNQHNNTKSTDTLTADSLVVLLQQALQTKDHALLNQCLLCTNESVIVTTIARLPTNRVIDLIHVLIAKYEKKPHARVLVTVWMKEVLTFHMSYLITVPEISVALRTMQGFFETRIASYTKIASLAGRLDLIMTQSSAKASSTTQHRNHVVPPNHTQLC